MQVGCEPTNLYYSMFYLISLFKNNTRRKIVDKIGTLLNDFFINEFITTYYILIVVSNSSGFFSNRINIHLTGLLVMSKLPSTFPCSNETEILWVKVICVD